MSIDMSQFYQVFFEESAEHLGEMERLLLEMDVDAPDSEEMNAIFRAAHSIKGGSGTFGFTDMTDVTHVLENLLDRLRKGEMAPRSEMIDVFLEAADVLKEQLQCHINGTVADKSPAEAVCEKLRALTLDTHEAGATVAAEPAQVASPAPALAPQAPAGQVYEIDFLADSHFLRRERAFDDLKQELSRLGTLEIVTQSDAASAPDIGKDKKSADKKGKGKKEDAKKGKAKKSAAASGSARYVFRLTTAASKGDIEEILSFVAAPSHYTITLTSGQTAPATAGDADDSYGFFDAPDPAESQGVADDGSFGLFDAPATAEADPGFGFFTDPAPPAPEVASDGDGYGFFEPVTAPPPAVVPATPKAAEAKPKEKPAAPASSGETSIRVGVERVDQLINLVGELVITQAMLAQTAANLDPILNETLHKGLAQLERNTRDLQESVMSIRMMPISFVFSRFRAWCAISLRN